MPASNCTPAKTCTTARLSSASLRAVNNHPRANILFDPSHMVLQQLDYLGFLDLYHERVRAFHVKDAEFRPNGRAGVYGGYQDWIDRPGRFRSLGDGQVDFHSIFSKMAQYDYPGWAVLEWECCIKHPEQGAAEGAPFIRDRIIRVTERAFDDFAGAGTTRRAIGEYWGLHNLSGNCADTQVSESRPPHGRRPVRGDPGPGAPRTVIPAGQRRREGGRLLTVISLPVTAYLRRSTGDENTRLVTGLP